MISPSLAATMYQSLLQGVLHSEISKAHKYGGASFLHQPFEVYYRLSRPWTFEGDLEWLRLSYKRLNSMADFGRLLFDHLRLPIVGQAAPNAELGRLTEYITFDSTENSLFFWGRVPIPVLLNSLGDFANIPPEKIYLDLGTPLHAGTGTGTLDTDIDDLLKQATDASSARCGAAIIDLGESAQHDPNDYSGNLRHAVTGNIELSDHAKKVLVTLLERIGPLLSDTTVSCALVRPPAQAITSGTSCFDQATTVELLDAVKALEPQLNADNKPAAINISLGTHVGPHNGDSPLEEYISTKLARRGERFVVVSAGNDGGTGLAAKRELVGGSREYLKLRTGPRCVDLLVEFWWYEPANSNLVIEVDLFERRNTGGRRQVGATRLRSGKTHQTLSSGHLGFPSMFTAQALFHSKCRNDLSCVAFSLSRLTTQLPTLEVEFALESTADATVNAWIVLCEQNPETAFIQGDADGTVRVPATANNVVSIAGNDPNGNMWINSSRGPSAEYGNSQVDPAPLMSHLAFRGAEAGTSFASPRACGDFLQTIADPLKLQNCSDATDLICETYNLTRSALTWNRRSGYHKVIA